MSVHKKRIEAAIFPRLLAWWMAAAKAHDRPDHAAILRTLRAAETEALATDRLSAKLKLLHALDRECAPILIGHPMPVVFMALAFSVNRMIDEGKILIRERSAFARAYESIKNALLEHQNDVDVINEGMVHDAEIVSDLLIRTMNEKGYFT